MDPQVPILMYHLVAPEPLPSFRKYTVMPQAFAAQMRWLSWARYTPVELDDLIIHRLGNQPLPDRPVIITFDDGFRASANHAVPILQERGFTATFFVVAGLMGKRSDWLVRERGVDLPLMDWAAVRELDADGFRVGSHSMNHSRLTELPDSACQVELQESRDVLQDHLGREVRQLAYPFGLHNEHVRAMAAQAGYDIACSTQIGLSGPGDELLSLRRVPITGYDSLMDFACKLWSARSPAETWRQHASSVLQRLGRAGRTTDGTSVER